MDNKLVVNRFSRPDLLEKCIATLKECSYLKAVSSQSTYDCLVRIDYNKRLSECELFVMSESLGNFSLNDTQGNDGLFASLVRSLLQDLGDYVPSSILLPCSLTNYDGFDFFWFFSVTSFLSDYAKRYYRTLLSNISIKHDTYAKARRKVGYTYERFIKGNMNASEKRKWFLQFICKYSYNKDILEKKLNESQETSGGDWFVSKDNEPLTITMRRVDKESGLSTTFYVNLIK